MEGEMHIFILAGQSNISGRGGCGPNGGPWDGFVPPEDERQPSVLRFNAKSRWVVAKDPLHSDVDTREPCGVGPGMSFANKFRTHLPDTATIGLVPCAVGGTAIKEWEKASELYDRMIHRAKESTKKKGVIKAVLWYQGESDTLSEPTADAYRGNMERLIHNVRCDLELPSLPFIQVALASGLPPYIEAVRAAQLGIDMPNVVCVDAWGLPLNEDYLHVATEGQVTLGMMLSKAYLINFFEPVVGREVHVSGESVEVDIC